jgi:FtsH-binding integral membrane protein
MNKLNPRPYSATTEAVEYDQGLRSYMLQVYNYMTLGLAITGFVALAFGKYMLENPAFAQSYLGSPIYWIVALSPVIIAFAFGFKIQSMSLRTAQVIFWGFAGLMGLSLSTLFLAYTGSSIARVFFITAATFGAVSLWGYTTKRDISNWGSFLFMGVIGLIIASLVNIFLQSSALQFAVSIIGVLLFTALTAYDTQRIREMYYQVQGTEFAGKAAVMGALNLYLDFINLFVSLMQLLGDRR